MSKNIVFWTGIKNESLTTKYGGFEWMEYSKQSWQYWCNKNNAKLVTFEEPYSDITRHRANWQKAIHCWDILDDEGRSSSDTVAAKSDSCFDNPRATVHFQDAFAYFLDEFGEEDSDDDAEEYTEDEEDEELFDSIIMDALDPDDFGIFVDKLYNE